MRLPSFCAKFYLKLRTLFPVDRQTHQANKYKSQNQEIGQAFEPRSGSTLLERSPDFAGRFKQESDAFAMDISMILPFA